MSMSAEQTKALLKKFHQIDRNADGVLSIDEIQSIVSLSGLPPSQAQDFMNLFDLSGDNKVTLQEYMSALGLDPPPPADLKTWKAAFDSIDTDQSGDLTRDEIRTLMRQLNYNRCTEDQIREWMDNIDTNGDGKISFAEFCTFMEMSTQSAAS